MRWKLTPYEKRLTRQLPPISVAQIEYMRWKYRHALYMVMAELHSNSKRCRDSEETMRELYDDLYWDRERYKITTIQHFEGWLIKAFEKKISDDDKCSMWTYLRQEIIGDRIYRSRIFDDISNKYFNHCVEKLTFAGVSNPVLAAASAFEDVENYHISYEEDEEQFVKELKSALNLYCNKEHRPQINLKVIQPLLEIAVNI